VSAAVILPDVIQPASLPVLALQIRNAHAAAEMNAIAAVVQARQAGALLIEVKGRLRHGEWLPWLAANCPEIHERVAQNYTRIARNWDRILSAAETRTGRSYLPGIHEALRLLAEPADGDEDEQNESGDGEEDEGDDDGDNSGEQPPPPPRRIRLNRVVLLLREHEHRECLQLVRDLKADLGAANTKDVVLECLRRVAASIPRPE
jgi:hypothetical protein